MTLSAPLAIDFLKRCSDIEHKYFNAKMIVVCLENKIVDNESLFASFQTPEEINKRIAMWNELILQLESSQVLA